MTLKKLTQDHYIIVDDSEIKEGDWIFNEYQRQIDKFSIGRGVGLCKKITHSTQPLGIIHGENGKETIVYGSIGYISLQEVKELIGEVDVVKKAEEIYLKYNNNQYLYGDSVDMQLSYKAGVVDGYNQAIEDNKDRKYTEEQLIKFADFVDSEFMRKYSNGWRKITNDPNDYPKNFATISDKELIEWFNKSLQPKTEWNVDFVDGKLKLK
jgi:hypothetical protein